MHRVPRDLGFGKHIDPVVKPRFADAFGALRLVKTSALIFPAIAIFLVHGFVLRLVTHNPIRRRRRLLKNVIRYSKFALRAMRVTVKISSNDPDLTSTLERENFLIVSNHLSYLDMMVLTRLAPSVFVTSVDMGQVPFLGAMAEIGGSLFVERRHRERILHDVAQLERTLSDGFHVTLFPEGTSGDGSAVLPFKRSLLTAAARADKSILPVTLQYPEIDGEPFATENRDAVCWYGKMTFLPHFVRLMSLTSVTAVLTVHRPMKYSIDIDKDRVSKELHRQVAQAYQTGPLQCC